MNICNRVKWAGTRWPECEYPAVRLIKRPWQAEYDEWCPERIEICHKSGATTLRLSPRRARQPGKVPELGGRLSHSPVKCELSVPIKWKAQR